MKMIVLVDNLGNVIDFWGLRFRRIVFTLELSCLYTVKQ